jgi:SAM-dependent methyltransferase
MKTLDEMIVEDKKNTPVKSDVYSKFNDHRYKDVREQSKSDGWWDGPPRYQFVNRNIPSQIQRDSLFLFTQATCKHLGVGLGIGGTPISGVLHVNVGVDTCDVVVTDHNLPFETNSVGYIISSHTLEHIPNTDLALAEWIRVLKPGGLIAITIPDRRFFLHDNGPHIGKYDYAYCEMNPDELKACLDKRKDAVELLLFNTNDNGFDINALLRKKDVEVRK